MSQNPKICLIDDDEIYQFTMTRALLQNHLTEDIQCFYNGEKALYYLQENTKLGKEIPDIIFLDINMPVMDGWQFMEEFIKLKPLLKKNVKVYLVSSSVDESDQLKAKEIKEISDYIIKPMQLDALDKVFKTLN